MHNNNLKRFLFFIIKLKHLDQKPQSKIASNLVLPTLSDLVSAFFPYILTFLAVRFKRESFPSQEELSKLTHQELQCRKFTEMSKRVSSLFSYAIKNAGGMIYTYPTKYESNFIFINFIPCKVMYKKRHNYRR